MAISTIDTHGFDAYAYCNFYTTGYVPIRGIIEQGDQFGGWTAASQSTPFGARICLGVRVVVCLSIVSICLFFLSSL